MFNEIAFDELLQHNKTDEAYSWCLSSLKEYPWFLRLKAMAAFGAMAAGRRETAFQIVKELDEALVDNEWLKAVYFLYTDEVWKEEIPWYLGGLEPLDATWVLRFFCLGFNAKGRLLCRLIMLHGDPEDRERLRRDVLFNTCPDDVM